MMGQQEYGIDPIMLRHYAHQVKELVDYGVEVAVVIGGGNIYRGVQAANTGFDRVQEIKIGMLATVINAMALRKAGGMCGVVNRLITAIEMKQPQSLISAEEPFATLKRKGGDFLSGNW
ncbi:MAG: hypothetical protein R2784_15225 [Saprospiraceae bacterium]